MPKHPNTNSKNNSTPHPDVNWEKVRAEHGKPDPATQRKFENNLAKLDRRPEEKGGSGR